MKRFPFPEKECSRRMTSKLAFSRKVGIWIQSFSTRKREAKVQKKSGENIQETYVPECVCYEKKVVETFC